MADGLNLWGKVVSSLMLIDPACLGFPDEETMSDTDGLVENHDYRDFRGLPPSLFEEVLEAEAALLALPPDHNEDEHSDLYEPLMGLEPGVASTVVALSVIGACPVTSCSGQEGHYEKYPLVYVWLSAEQIALVEQAAGETGVDVRGIDTPGVLISVPTSGDLQRMRDFAVRLVAGSESDLPV